MPSNLSVQDLENFWPYKVAVLADLVSRHMVEILKSHSNLNLSQWRVLAAVAAKPGRTSADVVTVTPMDKGIVSRAVMSLIDAGLLEKTANPDDKRSSVLHMTRSGSSIYQVISSDLNEHLTKIETQITNAELFSELLEQYMEGMISTKTKHMK